MTRHRDRLAGHWSADDIGLHHHMQEMAQKQAWKDIAGDRAKIWAMYRETFGIEDRPALPAPEQTQEQAPTPARRRRWRDVADPAIDTPGPGLAQRRSA